MLMAFKIREFESFVICYAVLLYFSDICITILEVSLRFLSGLVRTVPDCCAQIQSYFRCNPCDMSSSEFDIMECLRATGGKEIVKRGTLLDNILADLGQSLPPQFDHGDFNY